MATGFTRLNCILFCFLAATPAAAADIALIGVIGDKAAVLALDGGDPKTVKVGQKWSGITILSVEKDRATIEVDGKKRVLVRGEHYRNASASASSSRQSAILASDASGHFISEGAVNGAPVRFVVDTGAT